MADGSWRRLKACRRDVCQLGLLRPLAQPLRRLVCDGDLRQPHQDAQLPPRRSHEAGLRWRLPPLALAWARARARPGRGLLVAAGMAVAMAGFGAVVGAGTITAELATRRAVERLGRPTSGSFTLGWYGVPPADRLRRDRPPRDAGAGPAERRPPSRTA